MYLQKNPETGNWIDDVARAYAAHTTEFGTAAYSFAEWHNMSECPAHSLCNFCLVK